MDFFANITPMQIAGLALLAGGAAVSFAARKISAKFQYENADMICRFVGFGAAITGFLIIFI